MSHNDPQHHTEDCCDEPPISLPIPNNALQGIAKTKKSRRGKNTASRGETALPKNRGNGFEEYFADPPMTPEEAMEERTEIYAPDLPFIERMQACIQRYRSRRRLQGEAPLMFNEYLFLGGVDTYPAAFGGFDPRDLKDMTPAQRREATSTDIIYGTTAAGDKYYDGNKDTWTVDFLGVAAGFFSVTLVHITSFEPKLMEQGIGIVDNFLRYVLHHDVCPEYKDNVIAALAVCEDARREWPMLRRLYASWPGQFNSAASELFCSNNTAETWSFEHFHVNQPEGFDARSTFYSAITLMDEPGLFSQICEKPPQVIKEFDCSLELIEILRPDEDIINRFRSLAIDNKNFRLAPIGKARFKPAIIEDDWVNPMDPCPIKGNTTLFLDDNLLMNMPIGMKARWSICELDIGLRFIKAMDMFFPSFYTFLPQELMRYFKSSKETDRPPPSINT